MRVRALLAVFICGCDANLKLSKEFLEMIPVHDRMTRADIFGTLILVIGVLKKFELHFF